MLTCKALKGTIISVGPNYDRLLEIRVNCVNLASDTVINIGNRFGVYPQVAHCYTMQMIGENIDTTFLNVCFSKTMHRTFI